MGKIYRKIYVDEQIYEEFKEAIRPLRVSQSIELYMKAAIQSKGSFFESLIDDMVENVFKRKAVRR